MSGTDPVTGAFRHPFEYRDRPFEIRVRDDGAVELYLDGCLRKRRERGPTPQYLWTNVELEWEEHHYLEVRFWAESGLLRVWANRRPLLESTLTRD